MSTIRGWWKEDPDLTQRFFNQEVGQPGQAPATCESWICKSILEQHMTSPAMWCICQFQDLLGVDEQLCRTNPEDERINVPANPRHYWRYRMHLPLETLLKCDRFNDGIRDLVRQGNR